MTHKVGTHLGGIRTWEDLVGRCVLDRHTGCMHLRTARGGAMPKDKRHTVWLAGHGCISATRAALILRGEPIPDGHVTYRCCPSYDCILHLATRTWAEHGAATGQGNIATKTAANRKAGAARSKVDARARARLTYSTDQPLAQMARELGISQSWAWALKQKELAKTIGEV